MTLDYMRTHWCLVSAIEYYVMSGWSAKSQWRSQVEETSLIKVLSNKSFSIRSYRPSIVHLGNDCYAEIDLCAAVS